MNKIFASILFCSLCSIAQAQVLPEQIANLKEQLSNAGHDSTRLRLLEELAYGYRFSIVDSSLHYTDRAIQLAEKMNLPAKKANLQSLKGATILEAGDIPGSLHLQFEALKESEKLKDTSTKGYALNRIGNTYMELGDHRKANDYYFLSKNLFQAIGDSGMYFNEISNIGNIYELMQMPDSALYYQQIVYGAFERYPGRSFITTGEMMFRLGNAWKLKGDHEKALAFYKRGIAESVFDNDIRNLSMNNLFLSRLYDEMKMPDSALKYGRQALLSSQSASFKKGLYEASVLVSDIFRGKKQFDSAYVYLNKSNIYKDSLIGTGRLRELQHIVLDEQQRQREAEAKRIETANKQKQLALLAGLGVFLVIVFILYRNNKQKHKTNKVLENTLHDLRSTQSQLVQSEKMASLGELTAGIAHEIQNPLNFVNNFSEVNKELILEMKQEMDIGNMMQAKKVAGDVEDNEEKINFHGKRADAIVKSMLQHSRSGSVQKELTDINALADEYLRLSYHGLRAREKTFNAQIKSELDPSAGKVNIIPQEIGRVLLNLFNNAFYAVSDKARMKINGYEPTVIVNTKKSKDKILISVKDNGNGIPERIREKIFQPFFTTKPTGQGTGLGLSMSYDIVKAHGGEIKLQTSEGEGTEFVIELPAT